MRRFPADVLAARVELAGDAAHHLLRVSRIARGQRVVLFDGTGREATAELVDVRDGVAVLERIGEVREATPPHPLVLVVAVLKGPAMDRALRMGTEAGCTAVWTVHAARGVATGARVDRWTRVVTAAAQQCGRADVPEVRAPVPLSTALAAVSADWDRRIALPGSARLPAAAGPAAVGVGPEGGWSPGEVDAALASGWRPLGLGAWTLRADTAAAVAIAVTAPE